MNPAEEVKIRQASRWETFVWPGWLPVRARMPLIAQVTGAVALTALIVGPWWASAPDAIPPTTEIPTTVTPSAPPAIPAAPAPAPATATATPAPVVTPAEAAPVPATEAAPKPAPPVAPARPAHLNLDVRHSFRNVDFSVTVDGRQVVQTKLQGSGKRFGVFGKRSERGYTKTIDLTPGVHLVRVRVLSAEEKFDQSRVERFDLGSSSVASMRISADKSGLTLVAERPPAPAVTAETAAAAPVAPPPASVPAPPVQASAATLAVPQASTAASHQDVNAVADLLQSVRSMLIAIAGFVASAATGFVVQEYLRSRRIVFTPGGGRASAEGDRRKRRRPGKPAPRFEDDGDDDDDEYVAEADPEDQKVTS